MLSPSQASTLSCISCWLARAPLAAAPQLAPPLAHVGHTPLWARSGFSRAARRAAWQRVVTCCSTFGCVATCCATQLLRAVRDMALITRPASASNHPTREAAASPLMSTCMACAADFCRGLGPRRARHRRAARESAHIARPRAKAARPRAPRTCAQPARPPAVPFDDVVCAGLARRVCFAAHRSPLAT